MTASKTFYLHGLPGSYASEMKIVFGPSAIPPRLAALDRLGALGGQHAYNTAVLKAFDKVTRALHDDGPVRLVAFSLGAMPALKIAAGRSDRILSLELIAPAAPLQLGNFLDGMMGKPVFEAALQGKIRLGLLICAQSIGLKLAPGLIVRHLFATAPQTESRLIGLPERRRAFLAGMKHALHAYPDAYRAELDAYVADWTQTLSEVTRPVRIWQGTDDNWTPAAMARALADALSGPTEVKFLNGLSHYGALMHALPEIIAGDEESS